jgi:O-antigen/teichoic acid export membrane protein
MHWLGVCIFAGVAIVFFFWITSDTLVRWLLAMEYRSDGVKIIPWIAAGYLMVVVNQPLEKLLYSQQRTRLVTLIQSVSAGIAIVAGFVAAYFFGLFGVAVSVPVYFSIQLVITALMVSQTSRVK